MSTALAMLLEMMAEGKTRPTEGACREAAARIRELEEQLATLAERQREATTTACVAAIRHSQQTTDQCRAEVGAAGRATPLVTSRTVPTSAPFPAEPEVVS